MSERHRNRNYVERTWGILFKSRYTNVRIIVIIIIIIIIIVLSITLRSKQENMKVSE